jgi:flagellar basal-body rod protein FlgB
MISHGLAGPFRAWVKTNHLENANMAIGFNNALGLHPQALGLRERRSEVLAANLANADTPNYKARDLDFQAVLQGVKESELPLNVTHPSHLGAPAMPAGPELKYRNPFHPSLDGNTVESEQEQLRFAENALRYQASLRFLGDDFAGLKTAIRGE